MSQAGGKTGCPYPGLFQRRSHHGRRLHSHLETKHSGLSRRLGPLSLLPPTLLSLATPPISPPWLHPRHTHPGIIAWVELLGHGGDVLHQELVPFPLEADLVHVDVDGWYVFVATLDAVVLEVTKASVVSRILRRPPGVWTAQPPPPHL